MYSYFISDLHLDKNCLKSKNLFKKFLQEKAIYADHLFILGDFFEKWIGDDYNCKFNSEIKNLLKDITKKTKLYFMPGNRDFLIGEKFAKDVNCTLLPDPYIIELYGKRILLSHGDIFCTNNKLDVLFRYFLQNKISKAFFKMLPIKIRLYIADFLRNISSAKRKKNQKDIQNHIKDNSKKYNVNEHIIKNFMQKNNVNFFIHGHTHAPEVIKFNFTNNNKSNAERIVLGCWQDLAYILKYNSDHTYNLESIC